VSTYRNISDYSPGTAAGLGIPAGASANFRAFVEGLLQPEAARR
jgi:hypothetical protein